MGFPSESTQQTSIGNAIIVLEDLRKKAEVTATTLASRFQTFIQGLGGGDFDVEAEEGMEAARQGFCRLISSGSGSAILLPMFRDYMRIRSLPYTDVSSIFDGLYDDFIANTKKVKSRNITFGAVSLGGSNVGNGTVNRLTVDANGYKIEATTVEVKTAKCVGDANSAGDKGEEVFELRGTNASKDGLETLGSGYRGVLRAVSARDSANLINNPSFDTYDATLTPRFDSWTLTSGTTPTQDTSNYYRAMPGSSTNGAAVFGANALLTQTLAVRGTKLSPSVPYYLQVAYNRQVGSFTGDLKITLGATTKTVSLAAQTGWNVHRLDIGTGNWFKNFNAADLAVTVQVLNYSAGTLLVDDMIFAPYSQADGCYYAVVGGSTPFLKEDSATFTDSGGTSAIIQYWLWRCFGRYLPSVTDASETWADPS